MKTICSIIITLFVLASCSPSSKYEGPVLEPSAITKNMMSWLYYQRDYVQWSADFQALDTSLRPMERSDFLSRLITGKYFPLRIKTSDSSLCYQLYRIEDNVDKEIGKVVKNKAQIAYRNLQLEGSPLPNFDFVDLDENIFNPQTTKGKIVVLNCWFIHCQPCNEEMPELNKIVEQTKNRNDVVFIGLAIDRPDSLRTFLAKKEFRYAIVGDKKDYLRNGLGIVGYPTHIIVDRQGKIVKVIDGGINEFIDALNKEFAKKN